MKLKRYTTAFVAAAVFAPAIASAHVVVSPAQVGIGAFQTFSISVPNEKDQAVTQLKLEIPSGLEELNPTVKPGWDITTDKSDDGKGVTAITWSNGSIPVDLRDDFTFRAQTPAKATQLQWKAYQTYADGSVVSWDQKPDPKAGDDDSGDKGPYSITKVVNDLPDTDATTAPVEEQSPNTLPVILSVVAIVLSIGSLLKRPSK